MALVSPSDAEPAHAPLIQVGSVHFPAVLDRCSQVHAGPGHNGPQPHAPDPATKWQLKELLSGVIGGGRGPDRPGEGYHKRARRSGTPPKVVGGGEGSGHLLGGSGSGVDG